jgi:hypothetical protein
VTPSAGATASACATLWSVVAAIDLARLPDAPGGQARAISNLMGRGAAGESRHISCGRLRRNGGESGLNRSNRERPVLRLLSACYRLDTSLLSANNLPVIFPFRARRLPLPYFDNRMKIKIILAID